MTLYRVYSVAQSAAIFLNSMRYIIILMAKDRAYPFGVPTDRVGERVFQFFLILGQHEKKM